MSSLFTLTHVSTHLLCLFVLNIKTFLAWCQTPTYKPSMWEDSEFETSLVHIEYQSGYIVRPCLPIFLSLICLFLSLLQKKESLRRQKKQTKLKILLIKFKWEPEDKEGRPHVQDQPGLHLKKSTSAFQLSSHLPDMHQNDKHVGKEESHPYKKIKIIFPFLVFFF